MDIQSTENLAAADVSVNLMQSTIIALDPMRIKGNIAATCAVSCLVMPRVGDTVLCATHDSEQVYVLAILNRLSPDSETLIGSDAPLALQASRIAISGEHIDIVADQMNCNIGVMKRVIQKVEDVVGHCVSSFETLFTFANRSTRRTQELDETRAGHLKLESPTLVEVSGALTAISGEELIKMQSKQIHMG